MFGFKGDLVDSQGSLITIPNEWFHLTCNVNVANAGMIWGLLAADPGCMVVGPFADGRYTSLFVAQPGGVTPWYYFDTILPVIKADGMANTCKPLTHFCLVAITTAGPHKTSLLQVDTPVSP
jgi:hypothetical protein